jgi:hypothetical protein
MRISSNISIKQNLKNKIESVVVWLIAEKMVRLQYLFISLVICAVFKSVKSEVTEDQMRKTADLMRTICMKKVKVSKGDLFEQFSISIIKLSISFTFVIH